MDKQETCHLPTIYNTTGFITGLKGVYKTVDVGESWELNYTSEFFDYLWDYTGTSHFAPSIIEFDGENLGVLGGMQMKFNQFPNGKAYIARTTTLGE